MTEAHRRKKAPGQIRRAILESAARLAADTGFSSLSVQAVACAAGVTKGGFFHHFPSKQAMVDALFCELIGELDRAIDAEMAQETEGPGRFTRAYVNVMFGHMTTALREPCLPFSLSMLSDPTLNKLWSDWMKARLARHSNTDGGLELETVRLAADGFWLAAMCSSPVSDPEAIRTRLLAYTRNGGCA